MLKDYTWYYYLVILVLVTEQSYEQIDLIEGFHCIKYENRIVPVFFVFFNVRLLSVLRGQSVFSSPPQRPMTSDFEGFYIPDFIRYIYFPILIVEKEPVFSLLNVEC